jgi:hypothetical protein
MLPDDPYLCGHCVMGDCRGRSPEMFPNNISSNGQFFRFVSDQFKREIYQPQDFV